MAKASAATVVLRVELLDAQPLVWRRVRVPAAYTLGELHELIQLVMGWQDVHLHEFRVRDTRIGITDWPDIEAPEDVHSEADWSIADVLAPATAEFGYVYDLVDLWRHRLVFEPATRWGRAGASPLCLAGENACPPEDVGGAAGYARFLEALVDASHPEHRAYVDWVGGVWDVAAFDLNRVNRELMTRTAGAWARALCVPHGSPRPSVT
jgi:hypothetical protein